MSYFLDMSELVDRLKKMSLSIHALMIRLTAKPQSCTTEKDATKQENYSVTRPDLRVMLLKKLPIFREISVLSCPGL